MTFTDLQQEEHRKAFIEECRQKAWGAACHAEWIGKQLDNLTAEYQKLQNEDRTLEAEIETLKNALDSHTVENRNKRKELQDRRNALARGMKDFGAHVMEGQKAMQNLYASVESALALAKHAEEWSWKEAKATDEPQGVVLGLIALIIIVGALIAFELFVLFGPRSPEPTPANSDPAQESFMPPQQSCPNGDCKG